MRKIMYYVHQPLDGSSKDRTASSTGRSSGRNCPTTFHDPF
jgi:hypothetical protein